MTLNIILEASSLCWETKGRPIVSDIDVSVARGEILGLIGPNGSGKSTLLSMLAGLTKPTSGIVRLAGRPMHQMKRREIAQMLALVAQHSDTADRISVRDAVELGRTPWLSALRRWNNEDDLAVETALRAVDMVHMADRDWMSLSGGERQRIHIARAHAQQSQLLLLDEPTNHLDIHHQLAILDLIKSLSATSVVALHDMHHALHCDRILVMKGGRCVALGPTREILTSKLIRETFAVEAHLIRDPSGSSPVFSFKRISGKEM
ncbi:ABC transporter ATP-binding protein [uncultured Cohaesibacter sp.]|uniref:ABC transporter ATP-binding protein n=1 Tax=uncultured Cohaesibacter sp. TaxID=1002546 RepID=UPI0029C92846|nr:ABC transporter ATP-binding protein [uncultured Cohaesibacter sp.]